MKQLSGMAGAVTSARFQPNGDHFQAELSTFQELILPKKLSKKKNVFNQIAHPGQTRNYQNQ